jgi:hypothetical protein
MLQITMPLVRPQQQRPGSFITARVLALGSFTKWERAGFAAHWLGGSLIIQKPTAVLASKIFETSTSSIRRAVKAYDFETMPVLAAIWGDSSPLDRERFTCDHADELLQMLDRITAPAAA